MTKCKACGADIAKGVKKCPHCGKDQRNFFMRHKIITFILAIIVIGGIGSALGGGGDDKTATTNSASQNTESSTSKPTGASSGAKTNSTKKEPTVEQRQIAGKAVDLGAGTFLGGKDVQAGLYDVTPVEGQGNFTINGNDGDLKINEILGTAEGMGVPKVRAKVADNDKIQLQGINKVHFEPVTSSFVTEVKPLSLYSGVWKTGEDIAVGRYKAAPASGSGNFIVYDKTGMPKVNEVLGGDAGGVKEVTFDVSKGDVINIANLSQVNITPAN